MALNEDPPSETSKHYVDEDRSATMNGHDFHAYEEIGAVRNPSFSQHPGENALTLHYHKDVEPWADEACHSGVSDVYRTESHEDYKRRRMIERTDDADIQRVATQDIETHESEREHLLYQDPNIRFLQWVTGYTGKDNLKSFLTGFKKGKTDDTFFTSETTDSTLGEHRLCKNGKVLFTPQFIAARDDAFTKILSMGPHILPDWLSSNRSETDTRMQRMIDTPGLNMLFAKLTSALYANNSRSNPTRYYTKLNYRDQMQRVRNIHIELRAYFKANNKTRSLQPREFNTFLRKDW